MRRILISLTFALLLAGCDQPAEEQTASIGLGFYQRESPLSVTETMDRLEQAVRERGFRVFNRIDHAAGAASVDMELRPTQLLIFGNPQGGTPLMRNAQTIAIDLPLKALIYEGADGAVKIAFNHPAFLAARHDLANGEQVTARMTGLLDGLADAAAGEGDNSLQ